MKVLHRYHVQYMSTWSHANEREQAFIAPSRVYDHFVGRIWIIRYQHCWIAST